MSPRQGVERVEYGSASFVVAQPIGDSPAPAQAAKGVKGYVGPVVWSRSRQVWARLLDARDAKQHWQYSVAATCRELGALLEKPRAAAVLVSDLGRPEFAAHTRLWRSIIAERSAVEARSIAAAGDVDKAWRLAVRGARLSQTATDRFHWRGPRKNAVALLVATKIDEAEGARPMDSCARWTGRLDEALIRAEIDPASVAWTVASGRSRKLRSIDVLQADLCGPVIGLGRVAAKRLRDVGLDCGAHLPLGSAVRQMTDSEFDQFVKMRLRDGPPRLARDLGRPLPRALRASDRYVSSSSRKFV